MFLFGERPIWLSPDHQPHMRHLRDSLESEHNVPFVARSDPDDLFGHDHDLRAVARGLMYHFCVPRQDIGGVGRVGGLGLRCQALTGDHRDSHRRSLRRQQHADLAEQNRERENAERQDRGTRPVHVPSTPIPRDRQPRRQQRHDEHHAAHADPRRRLQQRQKIDLRIGGAAPGAVRRFQRERVIESDFEGREDERRQHPGPSPRRLGRAHHEGCKNDCARQCDASIVISGTAKLSPPHATRLPIRKAANASSAAVSVRSSGAIARIGSGANSAHTHIFGSAPPSVKSNAVATAARAARGQSAGRFGRTVRSENRSARVTQPRRTDDWAVRHNGQT